jgi:hypothetical protein
MRHMLALTAALTLLAGARAEDKQVKPLKEFKGRVSHELARAAKDGYVAGPKAWAKLWKDWKIEGKLPKIDWKNEIVLIATSGGSGMGLSASLDDKGDLKGIAFGTADIRPDSAFHIIVVPSKGVKTINGKKPTFEKNDAEP